MIEGRDTFEAFMHRREAAARAFVRGDPQPVAALLEGAPAATFFAPVGGHVRGTTEVSARFATDAAAFGPGGETSFAVLESGAGDEVAYWAGLQHAEVRLGDEPEPRRMSLRVTEIFRRVGGDWTLVHRHADPLVAEPEGK